MPVGIEKGEAEAVLFARMEASGAQMESGTGGYDWPWTMCRD